MANGSAEMVRKFYGKDPLAAQDALAELVKTLGRDAIEAIVPSEIPSFSTSSWAVEGRLKAAAEILGPGIVPHLVNVISSGPWRSKILASPCFAGLQAFNETLDAGLIRILEQGRDVDAERIAIEALGYLGAEGWGYRLQAYAQLGIWGAPADHDRISQYTFDKLSSYVLEALARFAAQCKDRNRCSHLVEQLAEYAELREKHLSSRSPDSYQLIGRHGREFTEWSVDPVIRHWGPHADARIQRMGMDVLHDIAPLRASRFLLETAINPAVAPAVRTGASIALGALREPRAAERLAAALRDPSIDRTHLDWAFSTLRAVPVDWSGSDDYAEVVLAEGFEPAAQLRYSFAVRGDDRCLPDLIDELDASEPFQRWTAALALARLLGPRSRTHLDGRAQDAGDDLERCGMYAAQVHAGDHAQVRRLHEALQGASLLYLIRPVWRLEILHAFRVSTAGFDERAFPLWCAAAGVGTRHLQYFDALLPGSSDAPSREARPPVPAQKPARTRVFISYSREDAGWLKRFQLMMSPLVRGERLDLWDDSRIRPGKWHAQINEAMAQADVALFLVSAHFLASEFIMKHELPELLRSAEERDVTILWVLVDDCLWEDSALAAYQSENAEQPLTLLPEGERTRVIKKACLRIRDLLAEEPA